MEADLTSDQATALVQRLRARGIGTVYPDPARERHRRQNIAAMARAEAAEVRSEGWRRYLLALAEKYEEGL